jgi:hypothetical protein
MVGYHMGFMPGQQMGNMAANTMATMIGHPMATMSMGLMHPPAMVNMHAHTMGSPSLSQGSTPTRSVGNMTFNPPMSQPCYSSPNGEEHAEEEDEEEVGDNQDVEGNTGKKAATRGPAFTDHEEEVICAAYLNTCTDPIVGMMPLYQSVYAQFISNSFRKPLSMLIMDACHACVQEQTRVPLPTRGVCSRPSKKVWEGAPRGP